MRRVIASTVTGATKRRSPIAWVPSVENLKAVFVGINNIAADAAEVMRYQEAVTEYR